MLRAAVFNTQFLPYSQTFVYEELKQHRRYAAEVFARVRLLPERFPFPEVHVAGPLYGFARTDGGFDRLFQERRYDVVHAHFGTGAVYAMRWAERFGLPLVVTFHGHDVTRLLSHERFFPANWRYAALSRRVFARMTLGLCASSELSELLTGLDVDSAKLRAHRLGIDLDAFRAGTRDPARAQVAMVGRLVAKKGFAHGLRAFAEVARSRPAAHLTLVGDGELERPLRALCRELSLQDRVTFTGALPAAAVAELLGTSDVLLAPSVVDARGDRESGLIVVKEASASRCVPIGTLHGGIPEIIDDGVTGYLVPERDEAALAARLATLLDDAQLRARMADAARAKMESQYDNRACVERLEGFYDEARALFAARTAPARP